MMRKVTTIIFLPLLLTAVCSLTTAQERIAATGAKTKEIGFRLKGLDGKFYDTTEMRGQVLVVSFGATWCVPCVWEQVAIEELKKEYAGKPVKFLWVSVEDTKRTSDNVLKHFVRERRMTVPVLRDPTGEALAQFTTGTRIPVVVFFDAEGRFDAPAHKGMSQDVIIYKQMVRERVDALLKSKDEEKSKPS